MLISHNKNGCGSGRSAQEYLEAKLDSNGIERAEIKILRGDPSLTTAVIDDINNKWKYSSAVIAWTKDDDPTPEQIEKVLDDYYALGFAGLEENRYSSYAVLHREQKGGVHVHIISARIDLQSGKAHNPCPPNSEYAFNEIAHYHNYANGWDRPDEAHRAKHLKKAKHKILLDAQEVRKGLLVEPDTKQLLDDFVVNRVSLGTVNNQEDVVKTLAEFGEITRVGRDYISVKLQGEKRAVRMKGGLYSAKFSREDTAEKARRESTLSKKDTRKSRQAYRRFLKTCDAKAKYNITRYGEADRANKFKSEASQQESLSRPADKVKTGERSGRKILVDKKASLNNSVISSSSLGNSHTISVGDAKLPDKQNFRQSDRDSETRSDVESRSKKRTNSSDKGQNILIKQERNSSSQESELGGRVVRPVKRGVRENENLGENRSGGARRTSSDRTKVRLKNEQNKKKKNRVRYNNNLQTLSQCKLDAKNKLSARLLLLDNGSSGRSQTNRLRRLRVDRRGGLDDDRARIEAVGSIRKARKNDARISRASRDIDEKSGRLSESARKFSESFRKHMNNSEDELQRFKTEINLSEYLASHGFELDEHKSCTSYAVMRKDDLKYVVTQDRNDAHYVFTDAHNPTNSGSVIDACQALTGKNLGQVRKELRPWIGANKPIFSDKKYQKNIKKSEHDFAKVAVAFDNAKSVFDYSYFESRGIEKSTVDAFSETIKQSDKCTILFRHKSLESPDLSGYEYKSKEYAGFSKGGQKGLCFFRNADVEQIKKIVLCETAIDALSKAQLDKMPSDTAYVSLAGNPSAEQLEQLKVVVQHYDLDAVIAVDRDAGGDLIAEQIEKVLPGTAREVPGGKDWNEDLQKYQFEKQKKLDAQNEEERGFGMSM